MGFGEVYDYVGSKMEWIGAGLPFEGSDADKPRLGTLADPSVPTCSLDDTVGDIRRRVESWDVCIVVNDARVVLGLVRAEARGLDGGRSIRDVMIEGPRTYRAHVTPAELLPALEEKPRSWILVTNLDGALVGIVRPEQLREAEARGSG